MGIDGPGAAPGLLVETARWLGSHGCLDELIQTATSIRDGVGLHDGVVRLANMMPPLYALAAGLETSTDPCFSALAGRLQSMSAHVAMLGNGWLLVDDVIASELRLFPEAIRVDIEGALAAEVANRPKGEQ